MIATYTLVDAHGARQSGNALSYTLWLFLLSGIPLPLWAVYTRGSAVLHYARQHWPLGLAGGVGTTASYAMALWAMTQVPVAMVSALRESSILFALLISVFLLRERIPARAGWQRCSSSAVCWRCAWRERRIGGAGRWPATLPLQRRHRLQVAVDQLDGHHHRILAALCSRVVARAAADLVEAFAVVQRQCRRIGWAHFQEHALCAAIGGQPHQRAQRRPSPRDCASGSMQMFSTCASSAAMLSTP